MPKIHEHIASQFVSLDWMCSWGAQIIWDPANAPRTCKGANKKMGVWQMRVRYLTSVGVPVRHLCDLGLPTTLSLQHAQDCSESNNSGGTTFWQVHVGSKLTCCILLKKSFFCIGLMKYEDFRISLWFLRGQEFSSVGNIHSMRVQKSMKILV